MNRLLVLFIDAFRYDYLSEERTPFLYSMSKNGFCAPLTPILGYSDVIDATIFTSVYPEDHGYWIMHKYSPENSPFRASRSTPVLASTVSLIFGWVLEGLTRIQPFSKSTLTPSMVFMLG